MKKSTIIGSSVNLLGMLCLIGFVWSARDLALVEGRDSYDFGDSAGFFMVVAPALLLCLITDLIWAGIALMAIFRRHGYQSAIACVIVFVLWTVVVLVTGKMARLPSNLALQRTASPTAELER